MNIKEVTDKVEKSFGGNGLLIVGCVFVALFAVSYFIQSKDSKNETVKITGAYASYPDSVTNADVIIDTLNEAIDTQKSEIINKIDESKSEIIEKIPEEIEAEVSSEVTESLYAKLNTLESNSRQTVSSIAGLVNEVSSINNTLASSGGAVQSSSYDDYFPKTDYEGISIVDGLVSIGERNQISHASRTRIAKANGITNYTSSGEQNLYLLDLLKKGQLKRG